MLPDNERHLLKKLARDSISHGLRHGAPMPVDLDSLPASLRAPGACFVTLYVHGTLKGCIGSLEAHRPLAEDVAHNAFAAAFRDHRFTPVDDASFSVLEIHLSLIGPSSPIDCQSQTDLEASLRSGTDGLIIEDGSHRATFLPSVWESLPTPHAFITALKRKAGLPEDYWSDSLRCYRYTTESF